MVTTRACLTGPTAARARSQPSERLPSLHRSVPLEHNRPPRLIAGRENGSPGRNVREREELDRRYSFDIHDTKASICGPSHALALRRGRTRVPTDRSRVPARRTCTGRQGAGPLRRPRPARRGMADRAEPMRFWQGAGRVRVFQIARREARRIEPTLHARKAARRSRRSAAPLPRTGPRTLRAPPLRSPHALAARPQAGASPRLVRPSRNGCAGPSFGKVSRVPMAASPVRRAAFSSRRCAGTVYPCRAGSNALFGPSAPSFSEDPPPAKLRLQGARSNAEQQRRPLAAPAAGR